MPLISQARAYPPGRSPRRSVPTGEMILMGRRQTGKTYLTMLYAVTEAYTGDRVVYVTWDHRVAVETFEQSLMICLRLELNVKKTIRTAGKLEIQFLSGGSVRFISSKYQRPIPISDLHIVDEATYTSWAPPPTIHRLLRVETLSPWE